MMNKNRYRTCPPKRKHKKKPSDNKKIGTAMLLLGIVTVMSLLLPLEVWVFLLSAVIIICGVLLVRRP